MHVLEHLWNRSARPERARSGPHHLSCQPVGILAELRRKEATHDASIRRHDETRLERRRRYDLGDPTDTIVDPAGGHIATAELTDRGNRLRWAIESKTGGGPIRFAPGIVLDVVPELLEPARGPRTHVSGAVVAVDDDRS
jgi:hypothetical protein